MSEEPTILQRAAFDLLHAAADKLELARSDLRQAFGLVAGDLPCDQKIAELALWMKSNASKIRTIAAEVRKES